MTVFKQFLLNIFHRRRRYFLQREFRPALLFFNSDDNVPSAGVFDIVGKCEF